MSYQVLARKWRPRTFRELIGQEHVVRVLVNALDNDRLHHAFLFAGTRGVGKTTISRILAKSLNCERGVTSSPCGECSACREVDEGRFVDLIEVDAASRTKVEDTRDLLENVQYAPTRGRYKVYLIDEVHMLSTHSFNALLKTLEEPPPHVKFLLATTDPQRLPVTILSRCLRFNLKRLPTTMIAEHLDRILVHENIPHEASALALVARAGDGSMRDALSLLDQAIAFGGGRVGLDDVKNMLGTIDQHHVLGLLAALAAGNAKDVLERLAELEWSTPDYQAILAELLSALQRIALVQAVPEATLDDSVTEPDELRRLAAAITPEDVQLFYQIALIGRRDLPLSPDPRGGLEMVLLRMLCFRPMQEGSSADRQTTSPDSAAIGSGPMNRIAESTLSTVGSTPEPSQRMLPPRPPAAAPAGADWSTVVTHLELKGLARQLALNCALQSHEGNTLRLLLDPSHAQLLTKNGEEGLRAALDNYYGERLRLQIQIGEPASATPAAQQSQLTAERRQAAVEIIKRDPNVRALCETFDAQVKPDSIVPMD